MNRHRLDILADLLLTTDPGTRHNLRLWFISLVTYVLYTAVLWVQVWLGYTPFHYAAMLGIAAAGANALFYVAVRMYRGPKKDEYLGGFQLFVGILFMWAGYAIAGPVAPATLIIIASHIVYAMFSVEPRKVWELVASSLVGIGVVMALCSYFIPERYPAGVQVVSWLYTALVIVLIARLAALVTHLHDSLRTQSRELAMALEKVRQLATRDDLTQVHNRRHITELLTMEQAQHDRTGSPLCVALLDIDLFKSINDHHGHQAGDEVLRRFALVTQQALRASDLLGRWGGEEFIVLFPDTSIHDAGVALERVREHLRRADYSNIAPDLKVTFSAGLVRIGKGERVEEAIERADQAMYRAKTNGRDCVVNGEPSDLGSALRA